MEKLVEKIIEEIKYPDISVEGLAEAGFIVTDGASGLIGLFELGNFSLKAKANIDLTSPQTEVKLATLVGTLAALWLTSLTANVLVAGVKIKELKAAIRKDKRLEEIRNEFK